MNATFNGHYDKCRLLPSIAIWKPRRVSCATHFAQWSISFSILFWTFTIYKATR